MMNFSGPEWNNQTEYPSLISTEITADHEQALYLLDEYEKLTEAFPDQVTTEGLRGIVSMQNQIMVLLMNIRGFASCELDIDTANEGAKQWLKKLDQPFSRFYVLTNKVDLVIGRLSSETFNELLIDPVIKTRGFRFEQEKRKRLISMSDDAEHAVAMLEPTGLSAWSDLYNHSMSRIEVQVELDGTNQKLGHAKARTLLQDKNENTRMRVWQAMQEVFSERRETAALVMNQLAAWRLGICSLRSKAQSRTISFLDEPVLENRITVETLQSMNSVLCDHRSIGQKALKLNAKVLEKERLDPWDFAAPCISDRKIPYSEGLRIIRESFGAVSGKLADFVSMMDDNHWIDAAPRPRKKSGANAPKFMKSRTPRVRMTYSGTLSDLRVLAHELGHAFHFWSMGDISYQEAVPPMVLAESASTFCEFAFSNYCTQEALGIEDKLSCYWDDMQSIELYLINVPSRFEYESAFYERRSQGSFSVKEFDELSRKSLQNWYGDSVSSVDPTFWVSKNHFYKDSPSFYNFPYSFGYLFSLGLWTRFEESRKTNKIGRFYDVYVELLRDSGRMTVEELVLKHLSIDLSTRQFWEASMQTVGRRVESFEIFLQKQCCI